MYMVKLMTLQEKHFTITTETLQNSAIKNKEIVINNATARLLYEGEKGHLRYRFGPLGFFLDLGSLLNSSEHLCYTVFLKSLENLFESNNLARTVNNCIVSLSFYLYNVDVLVCRC